MLLRATGACGRELGALLERALASTSLLQLSWTASHQGTCQSRASCVTCDVPFTRRMKWEGLSVDQYWPSL